MMNAFNRRVATLATRASALAIRVSVRARRSAALLAFGALALFVASSCATSGSRHNAKAAAAGFVTVRDGQFMLGGKPFRFAGTNNYYMHYESDKMQADVLDAAVGMDFKVLRVWGFMNGLTSQNRDHNVYGMTEPPTAESTGAFGVPESKKKVKGVKDAFERLDYTIAEAGKRNLKLVIALNNYWADFGGIQQASAWQKWLNLAKPEDFYTDAAARESYKAYVKYLLTRVNSYTGVPYNQDPTIMTWELMNEPRNPSDKTCEVVTAWADEMSAWVKELAPMQLCAVGDEGGFKRADLSGFMDEGNHMYNGFEGTDFDALLELKNVDYGTYHLYPEAWGIKGEAVEGWGTKYIKDHIDSGKAAKKPVVLEEYGISATGDQNRLAIYDEWNRTVLEEGGAGSMVWILTASNDKELADNPPGDGIYDDYDGFRVMNDQSPVSTLLREYAIKMVASVGAPDSAAGSSAASAADPSAGSPAIDSPRVYLMDPSKDRDVKGFYRVRAQAVEAGKKVKEARLHVNGEKANLLQYNREQNVWRFNLDTNVIEDGSRLALKGVFTFDDGTILETEEHTVTVANRITYSELVTYDFKDSDYGASSLGAYQATLKSIAHTDLNGGMLAVDAEFPGTNEWEELKVKFVPLEGIPESAKIRFTVYLRKDLATPSVTKSNPENSLPGFQPYVAFDPGWVKTGLHENNRYLKDTEVVKLPDGNEYYRQTVELEFFRNPQFTGVTICPTLGYVAYTGPVYIDDIVLFKKD